MKDSADESESASEYTSEGGGTSNSEEEYSSSSVSESENSLKDRRESHGRASVSAKALRNMTTNKATIQDGERLDKPVPAKFPRKPMVELQACSNVWYQGAVIKESANEVKIAYSVPNQQGKIKPRVEWFSKSSARIWRGSYKTHDWRHLGKGAWAPRATPKQGRSRRSGTRPRKPKQRTRQKSVDSSDEEESSEEPAEEPPPPPTRHRHRQHGVSARPESGSRGAVARDAGRAPVQPVLKQHDGERKRERERDSKRERDHDCELEDHEGECERECDKEREREQPAEKPHHQQSAGTAARHARGGGHVASDTSQRPRSDLMGSRGAGAGGSGKDAPAGLGRAAAVAKRPVPDEEQASEHSPNVAESPGGILCDQFSARCSPSDEEEAAGREQGGLQDPGYDPLARWFEVHYAQLQAAGTLARLPGGMYECGHLPASFVVDPATLQIVLDPSASKAAPGTGADHHPVAPRSAPAADAAKAAAVPSLQQQDVAPLQLRTNSGSGRHLMQQRHLAKQNSAGSSEVSGRDAPLLLSGTGSSEQKRGSLPAPPAVGGAGGAKATVEVREATNNVAAAVGASTLAAAAAVGAPPPSKKQKRAVIISESEEDEDGQMPPAGASINHSCPPPGSSAPAPPATAPAVQPAAAAPPAAVPASVPPPVPKLPVASLAAEGRIAASSSGEGVARAPSFNNGNGFRSAPSSAGGTTESGSSTQQGAAAAAAAPVPLRNGGSSGGAPPPGKEAPAARPQVPGNSTPPRPTAKPCGVASHRLSGGGGQPAAAPATAATALGGGPAAAAGSGSSSATEKPPPPPPPPPLPPKREAPSGHKAPPGPKLIMTDDNDL